MVPSRYRAGSIDGLGVSSLLERELATPVVCAGADDPDRLAGVVDNEALADLPSYHCNPGCSRLAPRDLKGAGQ